MKSGIQEIQIGKERAVIVPKDLWEQLIEQLEEIEDIKAYEASIAEPVEGFVELDEVCRNLGKSPLRYLRGQTEMSRAQLARKSGLSQSLIAKIEANEKRPSDSARKKLAKALKIPAEKLIY